MRPEDFGRFIEEAFTKIEPLDDAHRQKLADLREKLRKPSEEIARQVARIQDDMERMSERHSDVLTISRERSQIAEESTMAMIAAFEEQSDLIDRIVSACRRREA